MNTTNFLTLPDGRQLTYAEYGDRTGHPVFYFHGVPSSRLEPLLLGNETLIRLGLRVIAPDRPGFGQSNFQPNRGFSDWVKDVVILADALGVDQFSVLGFSAGGGYAAACAAKIPERLHTAVIVAGAWQMDTIADLLKRGHRTLIVIKTFPIVHRVLLKLQQRSLKTPPEKLLPKLKKKLFPIDYAVWEPPGRLETSNQASIEGFRLGTRGTAWDVQLYLRPWDFSLNEIQMPLTIFHGEQDASISLDFVKQVAATLPTAKLVTFPDEGHLSILINQIDAIAKALKQGQ